MIRYNYVTAFIILNLNPVAVMSLSSFLLVMTNYEEKEAGKAGLFYFAMTQLSTMCLMAGFLALYALTGSYSIPFAAGVDPAALSVVFVVLFVGFGIKAGVVPFHKWLPYAHPASPSNISALMSGVMIKVAIYGLIRFVSGVASPPGWWGGLILVAGTVSPVFSFFNTVILTSFPTIEPPAITPTFLICYMSTRVGERGVEHPSHSQPHLAERGFKTAPYRRRSTQKEHLFPTEIRKFCWCRWCDLNTQPLGLQPSALPG